MLMNGTRVLIAAAVAGACWLGSTPAALAQVSISIGAAPECPYGYYDAAPYRCAPSGYYGPEWFNREVFIGAGPWFHGANEFRGQVNNSYHPDHGYKGPMPSRGEKAQAGRRVDKAHFKGNEERDGREHGSGDKR